MSAARPAVKIMEPHWKPEYNGLDRFPSGSFRTGKTRYRGSRQNTQSDDEVIAAHLIAQEIADWR